MPVDHNGRIPYTRDDDVLLAKFIANYNPGPRGRGGNALYKKLVENAEGKWSWSSRHTWQSWRDRYCKNSEWFDSQILKYQKKHNIDPENPPTKDRKVAKRRRQSNSPEESELTGEEKRKTRTTMDKDKAGARQEEDAKAGKRRKVEDVKADTREEDIPGMKVEEDHASQLLNKVGTRRVEEEEAAPIVDTREDMLGVKVKEDHALQVLDEGESWRVEEAEAAPLASTLSEDDREVHARLSKSEKLYPALDTLPSPTLPPPPVPGSFDAPSNVAKKPKLKPKLRPVADDPFASSPSPSPSATTDRRPPHRSPPKLLQLPFRGPIHYSSPPHRRNDSNTESDPVLEDTQVDQPQWPSIRTVQRRATKDQSEVAEDHPAPPVVEAPAEAPKTLKVSPQVQPNIETSGPRDVGIAVDSTSKVTLNTPGRLTSHQVTDQIKDKPLDLVAVELRRQKSVDYRRRTSKRSGLTRVGELSAQNLEHHGRLLQLKDEGRRHSIAGIRPNLKADDLRVGSLRRSACSSRSSLAPSTSFIIPGQHATVNGSSIPSDERDLVATLGVNSALTMLAKKQGFSEEVAWDVWGATKSIKRTERVLLAMHEAAQSARQQAIEVLGDDSRSMDVDIIDASSLKLEGKPVPASVVGDFDRDDRALKATPIVRRRQYPPFHYTPTQEPEQPYLPPSSTRAGKTARLFSQGRGPEALERAKRTAKRSEYPISDKDLTHEGFDADLEGKPGTQDLFKWGEEHDDLFLHAGPETEDALTELERQVNDDKLIRQKFLHALSILHP